MFFFRRQKLSHGGIIQDHPKGTGIDVISKVQEDLEERAKIGVIRYGERLRSENGRNALIDAYQEALDLCVYLKQCLIEDENKKQ